MNISVYEYLGFPYSNCVILNVHMFKNMVSIKMVKFYFVMYLNLLCAPARL